MASGSTQRGKRRAHGNQVPPEAYLLGDIAIQNKKITGDVNQIEKVV